ncbi:MAG TPA: M48 family metallopeptidase [Pyrinomonadaceae bacterium]|nr:M48 family metallopeptidase [Pyrinomonadaceae bacterium]
MRVIETKRARRLSAVLMATALLLTPLAAGAQTRVEMPKNKYDKRDDVQAGQQAAQQVYQQMPILRDNTIDRYVDDVGQRLVSAIPAEFQHPEFRYSFDVVDARDINAFALPGGPMFINRGMIEAARTEGEMAGVMAHEISHVALRHATAQATETQKFQIGSVLGQIAGAVIGGVPGAAIGTAAQIGFGAGALKYSRKYETQADILGAQIMARAGYDPRDLANMFQTIERQGGGARGPEWLSSHPNPGNRYQRINQEAALLRVNPESARQDSRQFRDVQARLRGYPQARTMEEIARSGQRYPNQGGGSYPDNRTPQQDDRYARGERVAYPSTRYSAQGTNLFRANIPNNWRALGSDGNGASFAPEGAYGSSGITHGVLFAAERAGYNDLQRASQELVQSLTQTQGNSYLRQSSQWRRTTVNGRPALATSLTGRSPITGQNETVTLITTMLSDGNVFYMAAVAPTGEYRNYQRTFDDILRSLQINDRY